MLLAPERVGDTVKLSPACMGPAPSGANETPSNTSGGLGAGNAESNEPMALPSERVTL